MTTTARRIAALERKSRSQASRDAALWTLSSEEAAAVLLVLEQVGGERLVRQVVEAAEERQSAHSHMAGRRAESG